MDSVNKIGRNAPCPCGSGRKFKRCCGSHDAASHDAASRHKGYLASGTGGSDPGWACGATTSPPLEVVAYAMVAARVLPTRFRPERCINASWIFVEVMRRLGVLGARVTSVYVEAMNAVAFEMTAASNRDDTAYWERKGARSVLIDGIAPENTNQSWIGHVVGVVGDWLVDSASSQMTRQHKGIVLPEVLVLDAGSDFMAGRRTSSAKSSSGTFVRYQVRSNDLGYESSRGFNASPTNMRVVSEIESGVRRILGR